MNAPGWPDDLMLSMARLAYAAMGGDPNDPRRAQKVSKIQIALRDALSAPPSDADVREALRPYFWSTRPDMLEGATKAVLAAFAKPGLPRCETGGRYLCETSGGRLLYINHSDTWQECPNFITEMRDKIKRQGESLTKATYQAGQLEIRLKRYENALAEIAGCRAKYGATGFPMALHPDAASYMEGIAEHAIFGALAFPDHPVIPTTPLVFDDNSLRESRVLGPNWVWAKARIWGAWLLSKLKDKPYESR